MYVETRISNEPRLKIIIIIIKEIPTGNSPGSPDGQSAPAAAAPLTDEEEMVKYWKISQIQK